MLLQQDISYARAVERVVNPDPRALRHAASGLLLRTQRYDYVLGARILRIHVRTNVNGAPWWCSNDENSGRAKRGVGGQTAETGPAPRTTRTTGQAGAEYIGLRSGGAEHKKIR